MDFEIALWCPVSGFGNCKHEYENWCVYLMFLLDLTSINGKNLKRQPVFYLVIKKWFAKDWCGKNFWCSDNRGSDNWGLDNWGCTVADLTELI